MYSVTAIPAFTDNYIWSIEWPDGQCVIVDPGEAAPVLDYLQASNKHLTHILLTHHHFDHIGGVKSLLSHTQVPVIGPVDERIDSTSTTVTESDQFELHGVNFHVLEIPGHTRSHIAYYSQDSLFCGDTLFSVGCGRLFEGTPAQMQQSLDKLAALPAETRVYCAHEYTESNVRFALQVEPDNVALRRRSGEVTGLRNMHKITLPSTLENELAVNPFMRTDQPAVIAAARKIDPSVSEPADVLSVIRCWKDTN